MSLFRDVYTESIQISNPIFKIADENNSTTTDIHDIGFYGQFYDGTSINYTGLYRDATDGRYKLFTGLQVEPIVDTGFVNSVGAGYALASLDVQDLNASGSVTITGDLTVNGTATAVNVTTITVEDNIIIANAGPANMREDAGFVVKRISTNVDDDTPKQSGTAGSAGTSTTIELQAANGHGTASNYYRGWVIKFGGDITGTATVTSNTAVNPPVLTFSPAASGATSASTTYQLFNKVYVGTIYDESTDLITFYGFPREDTEAIIDPAGDAGNGNLADYVNIKAANVIAAGDVTAATGLNITSGNLNVQSGNATISGSLQVGSLLGPINIDDNILAINTGPANVLEDAGFVTQRSSANVALDTPKLAAVAVQAAYVSGPTLLVTNSASGVNYFKGWVITNSVDGSATSRTVLASSNVGTTHTLTLSSGFPSALTEVDTVNLYNRRFVGSIYDESKDYIQLVGFPREDGEAKIDIDTPVNGNVPDLLNLRVKDLDITGAFSFNGTVTRHTKTQSNGDYSLTVSDIVNNDIIYLGPSNATTTFTLPAISTLSIPTDTAFVIILVNIHPTNVSVIASAGGDTIEGLASVRLSRQWVKTVLFASGATGASWMIKG
jgi:hypothetical protein